MAFSRLVFTVLLLSVACYASNVPVFIWGDRTVDPELHPLTLTPSEFKSVLTKTLANDQFTVLFIDNTLSVEDFSEKNDFGETNFPYLQANTKKALYLQSVEDPVEVLISNDAEDEQIKLSELDNAQIDYKNAKRLTISLDDAQEGESRSELLLRHDNFMKNLMQKLQKHHENVVGIYTGYYPSWVVPTSHSISKRQVEQASGYYVVDGLRMYIKTITVRDGDKVDILSAPTSATSNLNDTLMSATLAFTDNTLVLNFRQRAGYWFFDSITHSASGATEDMLPTNDVYALMDFSYRCAQSVTFTASNGTKSITLEDLKVQPYFRTTNATEQFGDSFNCVGFFSAPIWAGLFVVFILLAITFYGIMMMMDIKTMDRFDDPKGKTITINAAE